MNMHQGSPPTLLGRPFAWSLSVDTVISSIHIQGLAEGLQIIDHARRSAAFVAVCYVVEDIDGLDEGRQVVSVLQTYTSA